MEPAVTWLWIAWLLAFAALEGWALLNHTAGDTLSEHVWQWFAVGKRGTITAGVRVRRVLLVCFCAWLAVHFLTGGWA